MNFAQQVISFNQSLSFSGRLPKGIRIMNPFRENKEINFITGAFYKKFYNDNKTRKLILGINPGRLGAGATGIPFTDTKRLEEYCKIKVATLSTHEPSSVFVYKLIEAYGGVKKFYSHFYINSICPLGFIKQNEKKNWINLNYYDDEKLYKAMQPFMISSLKTQLSFGIDTRTCFVLGKKNASYISRINEQENIFTRIVVLEHPRYIEQYKSKYREKYIAEFLEKLSG